MDPRKFGPDDDDSGNDHEWVDSDEFEPPDRYELMDLETDARDRRRAAAHRWNELNQKIARIAFGWVKGDGPYYLNEATKKPTGWYTDKSDGPKFEPTRKLSHALHAAAELARRRKTLPFSLRFDGESGWEARFPHRPYDTVVTDAEPTRAVYQAIFRLHAEVPDPNDAFRRDSNAPVREGGRAERIS